jgi:tripartite-type tricarboxylate transporter receptor subunit TctC
MIRQVFHAAAIAGAIFTGWTISASAQSPEEFYAGKTITIAVPFNPGGTSADFATYISEHLPNYIPGNPKIALEFMPGGGGVRATNHFFNVMPRDGTSLIVPDQAIVIAQHMSPDGVQYDAAQINWLGIAVPSRLVLMVRKDSGVATMDDLKSKEVFIGSSGVGSETDFFPRVTNALLGTKMNVVAGFPGGATEVLVAVESGEMQGSVNGWQSWGRRPDLVEMLNPIVTYGGGRDPGVPDTPAFSEFIDKPEDQQIVNFLSSIGVIGRGLATTPDVPEDRLQALRDAFDALMQDEGFRAKMQERGIPVTEPMSGADATQIVRDALSASPEVIARARELITVEQ